MRRALLPLLFIAALAGRAAAAPDFADELRGLWDRFRRLKPPTPVAAPIAAPTGALGRLVSWNVQTLGKKASRAKKEALRVGLERALEGQGPMILAAQEIANDKGAGTLARALPGEGRGWTTAFADTSDAMNNAVYAGPGTRMDCSGTVDLPGVLHPPHMAHVTVGDADFTVLSVHLAYAKGDASASAAELKLIMAWARRQAAKPGADPDIVIAGDFNMATGKGKEASRRAGDRSWETLETGAGFTALVDEPTSRRGKTGAANNYDHFIVSDDFFNEEFVVAGAISSVQVALAEHERGTRASDHYPIALTFRKSGAGRDGRPITLDGASACR